MDAATGWKGLIAALRAEWRHLRSFQSSHRPWAMPFAAALASGLPLLAGAMLGDMASALAASVGGLLFLYLPTTPMHYRMVTLMACGFAVATCFALGLGVQLLETSAALRIPLISLLTLLVVVTVRSTRC